MQAAALCPPNPSALESKVMVTLSLADGDAVPLVGDASAQDGFSGLTQVAAESVMTDHERLAPPRLVIVIVLAVLVFVLVFRVADKLPGLTETLGSGVRGAGVTEV